MLFQKRFWEGIADGSVTMTFRRWKRRQVVAGNRYRTGGGIVEVESIDVVDAGDISDSEAKAAGHASAEDLIADLPDRPEADLYRIVFHVIHEPDPRAVLAGDAALTPDAIAEIDARLERLDRASKRGPWTMEVLRMIQQRPHERAPNLAADFGQETQPFKLNVRKLKNLGLTLSFNPGYDLSPRGKAYLAATDRD